MSSILVIAPRWNTLSSIRRHVSRAVGQGAKVIVLTRVPLSQTDSDVLTNMGCSAVRTIENYISHAEVENIRCEVVKFMEELPNISAEFRKASEYRGVSLWRSSEMAFFYPLYDAVRYTECFARALERDKPDEAWAFEDRGPNLFWHDIPLESLGPLAHYWLNSRILNYNDVFARVAASAGVKFRPVSVPFWFRAVSSLMIAAMPKVYPAYVDLADRRHASKSLDSEIARVPPAKGCVMIISGGASADHVAIPLARTLCQKLSSGAFVLRWGASNTGAHRLLQAEGACYLLSENHKSPTPKLAAGESSEVPWRIVEKLPQVRHYFAWRSTVLWPALKNDMGLLFRGYFPILRRDIDTIANIIDETEPKAAMVTNTFSAQERALAYFAKAHGIPTLHVPFYALVEGVPPIPVTADWMALWGDDMQQFLIDRPGMGPPRTTITGNPAFEYRMGKALREENAANIAADPHKGERNVLFISQPAQQDFTPEKRRLHIEAVLNAARLLPHIHFVVRPHPMETSQLHLQIIRRHNIGNVAVDAATDLYQSILQSDLIITFTSTAGFETLFLGKPMIVVNLVGYPPGSIPYLRDGAAYGVYDADHLPKAIELVLTDENIRAQLAARREQALPRYLHLCDGRSAERVVAEIAAVIGDKS